MQQKLQTILFFTFLICVQISSINTLKIKNKFKSTLSDPVAAAPVVAAAVAPVVAAVAAPAPAVPTVAAPTPAVPAVAGLAAPVTTSIVATAPVDKHHNHKATTNQDLQNNLEKIGLNNTTIEQHRNQFHIHHVTPRNLTKTNNKLRAKIDEAHEKLGELNDVQKETLEARLFHKFPKKPAGVMNAAVIDLQKGKIAEQSMTFNLTSIQELSEAVSQANTLKSRTVTVDGHTYKLRKIGSNFFYGAIVGSGGIGAYLKDGYVTVITHNSFIGFDQFAYFFGQVIGGLKQNKQTEKWRYFKDNFEAKKDKLNTRLTNDRSKYNQEHPQ
jgi:hypothetical protein